jgi:hypothetical protein
MIVYFVYIEVRKGVEPGDLHYDTISGNTSEQLLFQTCMVRTPQLELLMGIHRKLHSRAACGDTQVGNRDVTVGQAQGDRKTGRGDSELVRMENLSRHDTDTLIIPCKSVGSACRVDQQKQEKMVTANVIKDSRQ